LGSTVAISRKSYVHPKLIEAARGFPSDPLNGMPRPRSRKWLSSEEVGLLEFLLKGRRKHPPRPKKGAVDAVVKAAEAGGPADVRKAAESTEAAA
jgi:DNA topoisomerase-1